MKKFLVVLIVFVLLAGVGGFFFITHSKSMTDSGSWQEVTNSEFSMTIPKTMKEGKSNYTSSFGQEGVAYYSNVMGSVSVSKIPYSKNQYLADMDVKEYMNSLTIDGQKLTAYPINDTYYCEYFTTQGKTENFVIEAFYKGDDALYGVAVRYRSNDRKKFEKSMIKWIESFKTK